MSDQIADLLARLRNAIAVGKTEIILPSSKVKRVILEILKREGYIKEVSTLTQDNHPYLKAVVSPTKIPAHIKQISKPGQRIYVKTSAIPRPLRGLGLIIISTSGGMTSGREAIKKGLGGELICEVW